MFTAVYVCTSMCRILKDGEYSRSPSDGQQLGIMKVFLVAQPDDAQQTSSD
jgi:hypothetical protein